MGLIKRCLLPLAVMMFCVLSCRAESVAGKEWKEKRSEHFIVYYDEFNRDFLDKLIRQAERLYTKITDNLGYMRYDYWTWDNRAKFYIYNDKDGYVSGTGQPRWSEGAADTYNKIITTYYGASDIFFNSILPHELGHLMFREFVGFKASVPLWFEEGVAVMQEVLMDEVRRHSARSRVKNAWRNKTFIPLTILSSMSVRDEDDESRVGLFYDEALMAVYFLMDEFGRERFVRLCRRIRDGDGFAEALVSVYRINSLEELNERFVEYISNE
ncbi:MAG: peptidase MA family metallohydrolase [Candidatus Omnitrophica bacterium]|nr:peptidase MA family metallohydrolase [Candidatus Omnitrophota bacterium]